MVRHILLTDSVIRSLTPPHAGEYSVHDTRQKGFALRIRSTGSKAFIAVYRLPGGRRGAVIGTPAKMAVSAARQVAKEIIAKAELALDPAREKALARKAMTVGELCTAYFKAGANGNKASTVYRDRGRVDRHIVPLIGTMATRDVLPADIERLRRAVADGKTATDVKTGRKRGRAIVRGGEGAARRVVGLLGSIFSFAVRDGIRSDNPVRGIRRGADGKRQRFLTSTELATLGKVLRQAATVGVNTKALKIIELLVLSGARLNEIAALKWQSVDFDRGLLFLPDSKKGPKVILLSTAAAQILRTVQRQPESQFVFPAETGGGFFQGTSKIWRKKIRPLCSLDDFHLHDARHHYASAALAGGFGLPMIGALLAHADPKTTARYAHFAAEPVRQAANAVAADIAAIMSGSAVQCVGTPL